MALIVVGVACLSTFLTGFQYNIGNNAYHIPITLGWIDDPNFAADPIVPTLHLFASPIYQMLRPIATEANLPTLFLLLVLIGRVTTFWAFDLIARRLGLVTLPMRAAFLLLLATSIGMYNTSEIGADGLLIPYFTHSELAQGVALLFVAAILRDRLTLAALLAGVVFAINAFIGVWMLAPLGLALLRPLASGGWREAAKRMLPAALAFTALAAPVTIWILRAQAGAATGPDFDYARFLAGFFGYHFFIGSATAEQQASALAQVASAAVAIAMLPLRFRTSCVLGGLVFVCIVGIVIGEVTSNRWLLNLHLMRSAGMIVLAGTPLVVAAALQSLTERRIAVAAPAALVLLCVLTSRWTLVLPAMIILFATVRYLRGDRANGSILAASSLLAPLVGGGLVLASSLTISTSNCCYGPAKPWDGRSTPDNLELGGSAPSAPHWREVQLWARANTPANAMFLLPPTLDSFRTGARRPVWITSKDGGAVPWDPAILPVWRERMAAIAALRGVDQHRRYACANAIDYVVIDGRTPTSGFDGSDALFRNAYFAVFPSGCGKHPRRESAKAVVG